MNIEIGLAVKVQHILGHISSLDGGIATVTTPHGTIIKTGLAWIEALSSDDTAKLQALVIDANALKDQYNSML